MEQGALTMQPMLVPAMTSTGMCGALRTNRGRRISESARAPPRPRARPMRGRSVGPGGGTEGAMARLVEPSPAHPSPVADLLLLWVVPIPFGPLLLPFRGSDSPVQRLSRLRYPASSVWSFVRPAAGAPEAATDTRVAGAGERPTAARRPDADAFDGARRSCAKGGLGNRAHGPMVWDSAGSESRERCPERHPSLLPNLVSGSQVAGQLRVWRVPRVYMIRARRESSACMHAILQPTDSMRVAALRASVLETP